jgi:uncharacterized RDD family membrane protein YckC
MPRSDDPAPGSGADDDTPPSGEEAEAQRGETVMPLVWIGLGAAVVAVFLVVAVLYGGVGHAPHATASLPPSPVASGA